MEEHQTALERGHIFCGVGSIMGSQSEIQCWSNLHGSSDQSGNERVELNGLSTGWVMSRGYNSQVSVIRSMKWERLASRELRVER